MSSSSLIGQGHQRQIDGRAARMPRARRDEALAKQRALVDVGIEFGLGANCRDRAPSARNGAPRAWDGSSRTPSARDCGEPDRAAPRPTPPPPAASGCRPAPRSRRRGCRRNWRCRNSACRRQVPAPGSRHRRRQRVGIRSSCGFWASTRDPGKRTRCRNGEPGQALHESRAAWREHCRFCVNSSIFTVTSIGASECMAAARQTACRSPGQGLTC